MKQQKSAKLKLVEENGTIVAYYFECPGCKSCHICHIKPYKNSIGASWEFNNDLEFPTFRPSILSTVIVTNTNEKKICHNFVTNGKIQFLNDCTHQLAGQKVDMTTIEI